jgi:hypothetical protein
VEQRGKKLPPPRLPSPLPTRCGVAPIWLLLSFRSLAFLAQARK